MISVKVVLLLGLLQCINSQAAMPCRSPQIPTVCHDPLTGKSVTTWISFDKLLAGAGYKPNPNKVTVETEDLDVEALKQQIAVLTQPGWVNGPDGYQFFLETKFVTFEEAKDMCAERGARVLLNGARNSSLRIYLQKNILVTSAKGNNWWINTSDAIVEGNWVWGDGVETKLDNASPEANWFRSQPDNTKNADCAWINKKKNYKWDDVTCDTRGSVICERQLQ